MAENLKNMQGFAALGVNLSRGKYGPLDVSNVFYSEAAFKWYLQFSSKAPAGLQGATRPTSVDTDFVPYPYEGQIVAVEIGGKVVVYVLGPELDAAKADGTWFEYEEVGAKTLGDGKSIQLSDDGILSIVGFDNAAENQVPYKKADGSIGWQAVTALVPDSIATIGDEKTINVTTNSQNHYVVSLIGEAGAADKAVLRKHVGEDGVASYVWDVIYSKAEVDTELAKKVDKVDGSRLMTNEEGTKLGSITASATDGVTVGDVTYKYDDTTLSGRVTTIENDYLKAADKTALEGSIETAQEAADNANAAITTLNGTGDGSISKKIADAISGITSFEMSIVTELPEQGSKGVIYLKAHAHGEGDGYDEYIWIENSGYEKIGNTDIDLSGFQAKITTDAKLSADLVADGTTNKVFTATEKTKLDELENYDDTALAGRVTTLENAGHITQADVKVDDVTIEKGAEDKLAVKAIAIAKVTGLQDALDAKQATLSAGTGLKLESNTIKFDDTVLFVFDGGNASAE